MAKISSALFDIGYIDTLSRQNSLIHGIDTRVKVLTTLVFLITIVSFKTHEISSLFPFFIYPVFLIILADLPFSYFVRKIIIVSPFAVLIGILNPFIDQTIVLYIGKIGISGGLISFFNILLRFILTVLSALILVATSGFNNICIALEKLYVPKMLVIQLLFIYRYLFVLIKEASQMSKGRKLRTFNGKGMGIKVYASLIGHLLLRALNRAQRIHMAMLSRGFDGEIRTASNMKFDKKSFLFFILWSIVFLIMRIYNLPQIVGYFVVIILK
ncbi:MAG: cobalt ECF transporter T component CbiQ [Desulfobacterales bacterium]|nr:cobalt ECF transporter T component CbiQ [Desulfobacterales bacterium]